MGLQSPTYEIDRRIGAVIKRERTLAGWSTSRLGAVVGEPGTQLPKYESGQEQMPASYLYAFCDALGLSVEKVYAEVERQTILH